MGRTTGSSRVENIDVAKYSTMHKPVSHSTTENYAVQAVRATKVKESSLRDEISSRQEHVCFIDGWKKETRGSN